MIYKAEIGLKTQIPSMNFIYRPGLRAGRYPYLYKDPKVVAFQKELIEVGKKTCLYEVRDLENVESLDVALTFRILKNFWRRDVSNMIKATEDGLVDIIGIDDSRTVKITASKIKDMRRKTEGLTIKIMVNFKK